jgi:hypothetical protein
MADLKLTELQRAEIVRAFARFGTPTEVAEAVGKEFGIELDRRQVWQYNPKNPKCAQKWRELHDEERERFIANLDELPIFHQAYRLHELQKLLDRHKRNPVVAREILRQAAEEIGGRYTNKIASDPDYPLAFTLKLGDRDGDGD